MTATLRAKHLRVYLEVKNVAALAIEESMDHYDFRRICALALTQAALEREKGNQSKAARRLGMSRNAFTVRARLKSKVPTKIGIDSEVVITDNPPQ